MIDREVRAWSERDACAGPIKMLMEGFLRDIEDGMVEKLGLRLNLLLCNSQGVLSSAVAINMDRALDRDLTWGENQGPYGYTFATGKITVEDFSQFAGQPFEAVAEIMRDSLIAWGLTKPHWQRLHHVGSALCVPIVHPLDNQHRIGVLVLDSTEPLSAAGFASEDLQRMWCRRAAYLGRKLQQYGCLPKLGGDRR